MSSAATSPVAVPKHSNQEDDHALVLPGTSSSTANDAAAQSSGAGKQSATAALSRALAGMLAFMFKRPIRLFRPVKISTWAGIQAIAEEQGRSVTPKFVRGLIRKEGWRFVPRHILPPLLVNTAIGLTLFTAYTTSESLLLPHLTSLSSQFLLVPFLSGALAGASQALLSAPLDNARLVLLRRQRFLRLSHIASSSSSLSNPRTRRGRGRPRLVPSTSSSAGVPFVSWLSLLRDSVFQSSSQSQSQSQSQSRSRLQTSDPSHSATTITATTGTSQSQPQSRFHCRSRSRLTLLLQGRRLARRGWSLFSLSLLKDSLAFGAFFLIFEVGREASRVGGMRWDGIEPYSAGVGGEGEGEGEGQGQEEGGKEKEKERRSPTGLCLQAVGILVSGGVASWVFSLVARPFERMRGAIWEGRTRWAEKTEKATQLNLIHQLNTSFPLTPSVTTPTKSARRPRRRISAGGASERRANRLLGSAAGRKEFRVRIGRIRTVNRRVKGLVERKRKRRKRAREEEEGKEKEKRRTLRPNLGLSAQQKSLLPLSIPATPIPIPPKPVSTSQQPDSMPLASSLIRSAFTRYGTLTFLFAPRSVLQFIDSRAPAPTAFGKSLLAPNTVRMTKSPPPPPPPGPSRLSARGRMNAEQVKNQTKGGRGWRATGRVLSYVPPYAVGLLVYALTAGDLKIEV